LIILVGWSKPDLLRLIWILVNFSLT